MESRIITRAAKYFAPLTVVACLDHNIPVPLYNPNGTYLDAQKGECGKYREQKINSTIQSASLIIRSNKMQRDNFRCGRDCGAASIA